MTLPLAYIFRNFSKNSETNQNQKDRSGKHGLAAATSRYRLELGGKSVEHPIYYSRAVLGIKHIKPVHIAKEAVVRERFNVGRYPAWLRSINLSVIFVRTISLRGVSR